MWLLQRGASPSAALQQGTRDSALHLAAAHGRLDIIKVLLAYGANYHAKNSQAQTPASVAHQARNTAEAACLLEIANGACRVPNRQTYSCMRVAWECPEGAGPEQARAKLVPDFARQQAGPTAGVLPAAGLQRVRMQMLHTLDHVPSDLTGNWDGPPSGGEEASQLLLQQLAAWPGSSTGAEAKGLLVAQQGAAGAAPDISDPRVKALQRAACVRGHSGLGSPGLQPHSSLPSLRKLLVALPACFTGELLWQALRALSPGRLYPYSIAFWLLQALALALASLQLLALWRRAARSELLLSRLLPEPKFPCVEVLLLCGLEPVEMVEAAAVAVLNLNYPGAKLVLVLADTRGRRDLYRLTRRLQFQCKWVACSWLLHMAW